MKKWYYYENDEVIGPFSEEDLIEKISPDTLLCPAGEENWQPAHEYPEIQSCFEEDNPSAEETDRSNGEEKQNSSLNVPEEQSTKKEPADTPIEERSGEPTESEEKIESAEPKAESKPEQAEPDENQIEAHEETLEPTLETLTRIARDANAEDLLREFKQYWDKYDREEQQIIYMEMKHLGILPDQDASS